MQRLGSTMVSEWRFWLAGVCCCHIVPEVFFCSLLSLSMAFYLALLSSCFLVKYLSVGCLIFFQQVHLFPLFFLFVFGRQWLPLVPLYFQSISCTAVYLLDSAFVLTPICFFFTFSLRLREITPRQNEELQFIH